MKIGDNLFGLLSVDTDVVDPLALNGLFLMQQSPSEVYKGIKINISVDLNTGFRRNLLDIYTDF